jgi:hypothetical protein
MVIPGEVATRGGSVAVEPGALELQCGYVGIK